MIICNHCGAPVPDGAAFCGECGTPNAVTARPAPPPPPQPAPDPRFRPAPDYPPKKSGAGLIIGLIIGLVVLGGVALFAMVASTSRDSSNNANAYATTNTISNSSGTNYNRNANTRPTATPNTNLPTNTATNYNTNTGATASPFQRAEDKIRSQVQLSSSELSGLNCWDLKLLRNTFFAKFGRTFDEPELQTYFDGKSWYTRDPYYSSNTQDPGITPVDKINIEVVKAAEDRQGCRRGK